MPRPAAGRRALVTTLVVCLAASAVAETGAQDGTQLRRYSRLERLEQWASALERHQPGEADEALRTLDHWTAGDLNELELTFSATLALIRDPTTRTFWRPIPRGARPGRRVQVLYSLGELRQLIAIAARLERLGHNHVLKRAAMLHTDAVALDSRVDSSGTSRRTDFFVFRFTDGQEVNREDAIGHWEIASFFLDRVQPGTRDVQPNPASDDWVRRWYRTTLAYMLARQYYGVRLANRGLEIFRDDPELLFFDGAMHETLASPVVQEAFRGADFYLRNSVALFPRKSELNTAEDRLRRAVTLRPMFAEARLRLGHVLAELDRHKDALPELTQALESIQNTGLQYYGHLFVGRSSAALGDAAAARAAFERAARLSPNAQSPLLALSQLAYSRGDVAEATAMLARVGDLPAADAGDLWWSYNVSAGRFYNLLRQDMVDALRAEMPK
jgi:tetratricopeptide (TPR) repeat protein